MDERISLRQKDKIPYGYYAVRNLLPSLFPRSPIYSDKHSPGNWDSISFASADQAVILTAVYFNADDNELKEILEFVQKGNYVFLITKSLSYNASQYLGLNNNNISTEGGLLTESSDSLELSLSLPPFEYDQKYIYPGRRFASYFTTIDSTKALVLGRNGTGKPNFIQLKSGGGALFLHTAPLAFSNYFVLHKKNIAYFEQAFSIIPEKVKKVLWNDYYLTKRNLPQKEPNWLSVLFRYEAFKWAMITTIAAILIYIFLEMRRKQRMIPIRTVLRNDSLDFVQTIGRLYYDQKDHKDLSKKMFVFFMDHIRTRYKISTDIPDSSFINALHIKSGYALSEVKNLVDSIEYVNRSRQITEKEVIKFYEQLEMFYQNT
jgi:hypothetical protein